jgi:pimeloyl-ACP methyl ester carboxylesterase
VNARAPAAWVLLKGIKQDARHWRSVPAALRAEIPVPVHVTELPGAGDQAGRAPALRVSGLVEDVRRRLPGDLPRPLGICGLSLGGMVALAWASAYPQEVAAVLVGNSSASDLSPPWRRLDVGVWSGIARAAASRDPFTRERIALDLVSASRSPEERDALAREHAAWQSVSGISRLNLLRQVWAGARFRLGAPPPVPVRVLVGARDRFVSPACSMRLAERLGVTPVVHPEAGHDLTLDAPAWFVHQLAGWHDELAADQASQATSPPGIQ